MIPEEQPFGKSRGTLPRIRGNSPFIVITFLYLAAVAGSFYVIETFYLSEKWTVIQSKINDSSYFQGVDTNRATITLKNFVETKLAYLKVDDPEDRQEIIQNNEEEVERLRQESREQLEEIVDNLPVIAATELQSMVDGEVLLSLERWNRLEEQHDFSNSLLTQDFHRAAKQTFAMNIDGEQKSVAQWHIHFTTAKNDPELEALTTKYWQVLAAAFLLLTMGYYVLLKFAFLPLRRVVLFMEHKDENRSPIIPNPANQLERAYNNLSRDAALTRLSKELRERISSQGLSYAEPILEQIPHILEELVSIRTSQVWTFHRRPGEDIWINDHMFSQKLQWFDEESFSEEVSELVNGCDPLLEPERWEGGILQQESRNSEERLYFCDILDVRQEHLWLFVIQASPREPSPSDWWLEYFRRISQELRYALSSVEDQRRLILQEKSKANISLSRNLGHDLTNIIATSKLELMTVRTILSQGPDALKDSTSKSKIFEQSLEALLNNTRFLQEIVNLYRSFSYLQKPKFEEVNVRDLVHDVAHLYKLTLSKAFQIEVNVKEDLPQTRVEPRLLRLALFNLLTNAVDAIKRASSAEAPQGVINVHAETIRNGEWFQIAVEDTGPGIRDSEGKLISTDALSEVFRLGYTTKASQEGEGLGLNWVQSIVREFHGGEVAARNREEGGAAFYIRIPIVNTERAGPIPDSKDSRPETHQELAKAAAHETKE